MRNLADIICNRNPLVLSETTSVKTACEQMRARQADSVLVCNAKGRLIGIFTGRDAVTRVLGAGKTGQARLKEAMTPAPVTMAPDHSAIDALRKMWDGGFRHLPLVEEDRILGVVSRNDFVSDERLTLDEERQLWEHMR